MGQTYEMEEAERKHNKKLKEAQRLLAHEVTQITELDLYSLWCDMHYPGQTLLLVSNTGEPDQDDTELLYCAERIVKDNLGDFKLECITDYNSAVLIYRVTSEDATKILSLAHDNKWDWGQEIYIWTEGRLIWGRD